ncbi:MAG TPA: MOSC N-terminal beta barrel domain-containing protein [Pseudonocardia sp.]
MRVTMMWRYPVKSMLGERVDEARLEMAGLPLDRGLALIDVMTGLVASAKHPRLWRDLLKYSAAVDNGRVLITSPAGWTRDALADGVDQLLSAALGRPVVVSSERPEAAAVERPDPQDVLDQGVAATVPAAMLEIGQGAPGTTFVDYAPVHVVTSATLDAIGTEHIRYRPNLVVETAPGTAPFVENDWLGRELHIAGGGDAAVLRVTLPTPRCAVPTLEHGLLGRAPHAVRALMTVNQVDVPGFGVLPCAGGYAEVVRGGVIHVGDEVTLV